MNNKESARCRIPFGSHAVVISLVTTIMGGCAAPDHEVVDVSAAQVSFVETKTLASFSTLVNGSYLCAEGGGGSEVNANRSEASSWERFTIVDINGGSLESGDQVFIVAPNGQYLQAEQGGGGSLNASSNNRLGWETFRLVKADGGGRITSGDLVGLQAVTSGRWISALNGGGGGVDVHGVRLDGWERFRITISALPNTNVATASPGFVHTSGTRIVDGKGKDLFLKGMNLGNWLVWEGYLMMGDYKFRTHSQFFDGLSRAFGSSQRAADFEYQWRLNYVDDRTIAELKGLGFNAVRVPFNHRLFWTNNQLVGDGFVFFDRLIDACRKYGVYVLFDMHGAPGYQNPGDHSDNGGSNASQPRDSVHFWDGDNVDVTARIWRHIANRYKNEPIVLGYDLINEPVPQAGREYELLPSLVAIRNAIREVDPNHVIVAEGSWWSSDLSKLDWEDGAVRARTGISSRWDSNLVYELHHYGPVAETMGREEITNRLKVPLILGEYGETDDANLAATSAWAKENLAGDFPWSFKKVSHDKSLWTVPTNADYDQVRSFIANGGSPPTGRYGAMIDFAKNNIRNGHPNLQWHQGFYDGVRP